MAEIGSWSEMRCGGRVGVLGQWRRSRLYLPIRGDQGHGVVVTAGTARLECRRHDGCTGRCPNNGMVWVVGDELVPLPEGV